MAAFATPALLGGSRTRVMSYIAYEVNLIELNWPFGRGHGDAAAGGDAGNRERVAEADDFRPTQGHLRMKALLRIYACADAIFMLAPLVMVVWMSFTPGRILLALPIHDFSLRWYRAAFAYPGFVDAFWLSAAAGLCPRSSRRCCRSSPAYALVRGRSFPRRRRVERAVPVAADDPGGGLRHRHAAVRQRGRALQHLPQPGR